MAPESPTAHTPAGSIRYKGRASGRPLLQLSRMMSKQC